MRIGIIGSGEVATHLAAGFARHGHAVTIGSRAPVKLVQWAQEHPQVKLGTFAIAAAFGELVVLAVKGPAATDAVAAAGLVNLSGKTVIDVTNPIADQPPVEGVLTFFVPPAGSLLEQLQQLVPDAHFVKAFNSVGADLMVDPKFAGGPPTMFICGNSAAAKATVTRLLQECGWEAADMGTARAARAIEPLCMLWCLPGFLHDRWGHAFKLLRS